MIKGRNTGRLDIRLMVEQPVIAKNTIGENETTWTSYKTLWAERVLKPSGERYEGKQEVGSDGADFRARYDSGLNTTMRFKQELETTYFYIRNVQSSRRDDYSLINAQRRDNQ